MFRFAILSLAFFTSLASASAQAPIPSDSRLKSIVDNKTIRIAYRTDATSFSFKNDKGEPAGFSLELCQLVGDDDAARSAAIELARMRGWSGDLRGAESAARQLLAGSPRRDELLPLLVDAGSLEYTRSRAIQLTEQARRELACLPASPCRAILENLTDRVVHRDC